jgi:hypothetical protein
MSYKYMMWTFVDLHGLFICMINTESISDSLVILHLFKILIIQRHHSLMSRMFTNSSEVNINIFVP